MNDPAPCRPTLQQELAHSITHGFGFLFGIVSIPVLIVQAAQSTNPAALAGACIYGFCFLMLFTFSTLYHGVQHPLAKRVLEKLDHISIYFLIAGSYTPFILVFVNNPAGIALLVALWVLTVCGIVFKIYLTGRYEGWSTFVYLAMGWLALPLAETFFADLPPIVTALIIAGAVLYSIGVVFFIWRKISCHHVIWHLFVLAASICHYGAVFYTVS
jgi:hemolysin III